MAIAIVISERGVRATNDENHIQELMAGANGDSRIQFVVVKQEFAGNIWGPQFGEGGQSRVMLVFFDAKGRETGRFKFPNNVPLDSNPQLIATQQFADLPGAPTPDFIMPPLLNPISGKVCFQNNPDNANAFLRSDCVAYGDFTGASFNNTGGCNGTIAAGSPTSQLPITNTVSLKRTSTACGSVANSNFTLNTAPTPVNDAGQTFTISVSSAASQGETLFKNEKFLGNGRTCAACHVADQSFRLPPSNIQSRFATVSETFDPLFVAETVNPFPSDAGFDFNVNTLMLTAAVASGQPCKGELSGVITSGGGARGSVLTRVSATKYLIFGGKSPQLSGTVSDTNGCSATVSSVTSGTVGAISGGALGLETPQRMRTSGSPDFSQGRGLILENIDGFPPTAPVFRKSPHLLNLSRTAPFGFSGDIANLQDFATGAVKQHFPRSLTRSSTNDDPDFRLPTATELADMETFMLAQEFPSGSDSDKFNLDKFATTAAQRRGRTAFFGTTAKCSECHGGTVLAQTTTAILDQASGINAVFNTGVVNQSINSASGDDLPCEKDQGTGSCGSRKFSVPQLFNVKNLTPLFHDASVPTVRKAVEFYGTAAFNNSPAGAAISGISMTAGMIDDIVAFLEGLVVRPYTLSTATLSFGSQTTTEGATASQTVTLTNTGSTAMTFSNPACTLTGTNSADFTITSCPSTSLGAGQSRAIQVAFDPTVVGSLTALLEINASDPSGIDLSGTGVCSGCFTDEELTSRSTLIKAVHITELRTRINAARTARGLAAFSFTDSNLASATIKAVHLTELRTALDGAYDAAHLARPSYTDPTVTSGSLLVKAVHITELRTAVRALE
jgi:cytochrome c peroxidase